MLANSQPVKQEDLTYFSVLHFYICVTGIYV